MTKCHTTRNFFLRDLTQERADKLKVAAWLHHVPMKAYFQSILEAHVKDLEKNGIPLVLPKGK